MCDGVQTGAECIYEIGQLSHLLRRVFAFGKACRMSRPAALNTSLTTLALSPIFILGGAPNGS